MFNRKWTDFWSLLKRIGRRQGKDRPQDPSWTSGWDAASAGKVALVLVILALFGTLAFLIISAVVRFFGGFFHHFEETGPM